MGKTIVWETKMDVALARAKANFPIAGDVYAQWHGHEWGMGYSWLVWTHHDGHPLGSHYCGNHSIHSMAASV